MWRGIPLQPIFPGPAEVLSLHMVEETGMPLCLFLSADLKQLVQSTYLGGNGDDDAIFHGRFRGGRGYVYVAGYTASTNFPGTSGGAQPGIWWRIMMPLCPF